MVLSVFFACLHVTETFDVPMIQALMEPEYQLYPLLVDSADCGHAGTARKRYYVIMRHVASTDCIFDPFELYELIREYITERVQTQPQDCTPELTPLQTSFTISSRHFPNNPFPNPSVIFFAATAGLPHRHRRGGCPGGASCCPDKELGLQPERV